ncbi:choice-of-anchor D domain-containing protein [Bacteroidales bacterium AH-315-I05]|nr:choice-of-anchor D domain-containing protein [Bacteroidales bacterium AH-315-I05]
MLRKFTWLFIFPTVLLLNGFVSAQDTCTVLPLVGFTGLNPAYCITDAPSVLTGTPTGGTFSGTGISGNVFTPANAGGGTHAISYTYIGYGIDTSLAFAPVAGSGTPTAMSDDDTARAPIGFTFNFFGLPYDSITISSNGFISFDNNNNDGCCSGDFLPTTFTPNNLIAFAWEDLYPPGNGSVEYFTTGIAPNRKLIVNFTSIPWCCDAIAKVTAQVVLYETSDIIEIHTTSTESSCCMTMGIENFDGSVAHVVPGRNSSLWIAASEMVRFTPDSCTFIDSQIVFVDVAPAIIALSDACMDLDTVMLNATNTSSLWIYNNGCDTLFVDSITNNLPHFYADTSTFYVLPLDSQLVVVSFSPTAAGTFNDTLYIYNNDIDTTVCLLGVGIPAPTISYNPTSFNVTVACGDSLTDTLTIYNTGVADLDYSLSFSGQVAGGTNIFFDGFESGNIATWVNEGGGYTKQVTTANPANGSYAAEMLGGVSVHLDGISHTFTSSTPDRVSFQIKSNSNTQYGTFVVIGNNPTSITVNTLIYMFMDINGQFYLNTFNVGAYSPNVWYNIELLNINWTAKTYDVYVNGALLVGGTSFRDVGLTTINEVHLYKWSTTANSYFDDITIGDPPASWLTTDITSDTVPSNDSSKAGVKFNSIGLNVGTYMDTIIITSNDPLSSPDTIPITMNVTGSSIIALSDSCFYLDSIMEFTTNDTTFWVRNDGCDTLFVDSITNNLSEFSIDTSTFFVLPGDSLQVLATFAPVNSGNYFDTLFIYNNDVNKTVCLSGKVFESPQISFVPDTFQVTINSCNDTINDTLTIFNNGGSDLLYNLTGTAGYDSTSFQNFTVSGQATNHIFSNLPPGTDSIFITVRLNGDYDSGTESADLIMDGTFIQTIPDGNPTNGTDIIVNYVFTSPQIDPWLADGQITVTLDNSVGVDPFVGTEIHEVRMQINGVSWFDIIANSNDTVLAGDSIKVPVQFNSTGLITGKYSVNINTNSNDPLSSINTIPAILTVNGFPLVAMSDICLDFDTIMQFATKTDTLWVYNTGCDTLFVDSMKVFTSEFSIDTSYFTILAGDSAQVQVTFAPSTINTFNDTLRIFNNDKDTFVCLIGVSVPPAIISVNPNSFNVTIIACNDSITDTLTTYNTGLSDLFYNIAGDSANVDSISSQTWTTSGVATNHTFTVNGNPDSIYITITINGDFDSGTEYADVIIDGTFIEQIPDGNPPNGTDIIRNYAYGGAQLAAWLADGQIVVTVDNSPGVDAFVGTELHTVQLQYNGVGNLPSWLNVSLTTADTIVSNDSTKVGVEFNALGLSAGAYTTNIALYSNDPVNPQLLVPVTMTVVGSPAIALSDTCLDLDTIMQWTTATDTVCIGNTGCDTLLITAITSNLPEFIVDTLPLSVSSQVALSSDDGQEFSPPNTPFLTSSSHFVFNDRQIGFRFQKIAIPQGAVVTNAYLQLHADGTDSSPMTMIFQGEANDNALTFATVFSDMSSRTRTTASVNWNVPAWTFNVNYQTPDVSLIVQEIVNRAGWAEGNSMVFFIESTGTGSRDVESFDGDAPNAPLLVIEYKPTNFVVMPGDSACITVDFVPTNTIGDFFDTLTIANNAGDTIVCLHGFATSAPIMTENPDTFNVTITTCNDTITDTLTIYNTGLGNLVFNIDTNGYVADFDGSGDYINRNTVSLPTGGGQLTVEAWIYPQAYSTDPNYTGIVSWGPRGCTGNGFLLSIQNNGRPSMSTWCNDFVPGTGPTATLNAWNHIACVLDGQNVTLYMNGQPISGTLGSSPVFSSMNLAIGCTDYPGRYFNGKMDEVRVWNTAKSQAEILASMDKTLTGSEAGLVGYWNFDDQTVNDLTASGNDGTMNGNTSIISFASPLSNFYTVSNINDTVLVGDSIKIPIDFSSAGLTTGTYIDSILIKGNDPLNPSDTVVLILTVIGSPSIALSNSGCFDLDSIIQFTTNTDTFWVYNNGCDTLFVDSITNNLSVYTVDTSNFSVLPGDSQQVMVTFSPLTVSVFDDTLTIFNNDADTLVCLTGESYPPPGIDVVPDTIIDTLTACEDSLIVPFTVYNNGSSDLIFDVGGLSGGASSPTSCIPTYTNLCSSGDYINNFTFNTLSRLGSGCNGQANNYIYDQTVTTTAYRDSTYSMTMQSGPSWSQGFGVWIDFNSDGDFADASEFVYASPTWSTVLFSTSVVIPSNAVLGKTRLRVRCNYNGTVSASDTCSNFSYGETEEYEFTIGGLLLSATPQQDTVAPADSSIVNVIFDATGLAPGTYSDSIVFNSNDPFNPQVFVPWTITKLAAPLLPSTSDTTICFGSPTPDLIAVGDSVRWYSDPGLTTMVFSGDTFATGETAVGVYTYYVIQTVNGCQSPSDTVTLTIYSIPVMPVASDDTICEFVSTPDFISTGANVQWYSDAALTTMIFAGNPYVPGITASGLYNFYVTQTVNGCESPADTSTLLIKDIPDAPVASDTTVCYNDPIPDLTATGTNIKWYDDAGLTSLVGTGNTFATGQTTIGFYTYWLTDSLNDCGPGPADSVILTIDTVPSSPATSDTATCFGNPVPDLTATGTTITWYDDVGLTNVVGTGSSFSTGQTAVGVYIYYVTDSIGSCGMGGSSSVTLTINAVPAVPSANDTTVCENQTIPDLIAVGANIQWYSDGGLTILVNSNDTFVTGQTIPNTYTYYVTQTVNNCESPSDTVTLIINAIPAAPIASDTTVCDNATIPSLAAVGSNIEWFSDGGLTILVSSNDTFATGQTTAGTYTYYITQTVLGCQSPSDTVILTINATPLVPVANDTSICDGAPVPNLTATGTNPKWYSDAGLTTLAGTGNSFNTGQSTPGIYVYWVTDSVNGCTSGADSATLTINSPSIAATGINTSADSTCPGQVVILSVSGGTLGVGANWMWYADSCSGTSIASGDSITVSPSVTTAYFVRAEGVCDTSTCVSDTVNVTNTQSTAPAGITASADSTCPGDVVTLYVNGGSLGTGATWEWYSGSCGGTALGSGDSINVSPTATTNYFARAEGTCNTTSCASTAVNVTKTLSVVSDSAVASINPTCPGQATTLSISGGSLGTGATWEWYTTSCGGTTAGSGGSISVSPLVTTTYYVRAEGTCNTTVCDSITINVTNIPSADPTAATVTQDTICAGNSTTLAVSGGSLGTGAIWEWYSGSCGGTSEGSGDSLSVSPTATTTYFVRAEGTCNTTVCVNVAVEVMPAPSAPTASNQSACEGGIIPDLTATGTNVQWYSDSALTTVVNTGNIFTTGQTVTGTYTYYVTDSANGCFSPATTVMLTIYALPAPPTGTDEVACVGSTIPDLTATGTTVEWYSDAALTTLVNTGNTYATGQTSAGIYTYYITQIDTVSGCVSIADSVTLTIVITPSAPGGTDETACSGLFVPDLTATGSAVQWYDDAGLTNLVDTGNTYSTGQTSVGIYTYYATQTVGGCESPADIVILTILQTPAVPTISSDSICEGLTVPDLTGSGNYLQWYDDSALTNLVNQGDTFVTGQTAAGVYTYYVTDSLPGCVSQGYTTSTLTIFAIPSSPAANDVSSCYGSPVPPLFASGTNINWYADAAGTTLLLSGSTFFTGDTILGTYVYFVTQTINGCESSTDSVTLSIVPSPLVPTINDEATCIGFPVPDLTGIGNDLKWYDDLLLTNLVYQGDTFATGQTIAGVYTYYITDSLPGCVSAPATASLIIYDIPPAPTALDTMVCYGENVPDLTASGAGVIQWYKDPTLLVLVYTGSSFATGHTQVGTYTYYVNQDLNGCISPADTATLSIQPAPLVTLNTYAITTNQGDSVLLIAYNASTYTWSPSAGLNTANGSTVMASPASTTTYTVTGTNDVGCSNDTSVTVTVIPLGIDEYGNGQYLMIFPNPTRDEFTLNFISGTNKVADLYLTNTLGEIIFMKKVKPENGIYTETFTVEQLAQGIYYLQLVTEQEAFVRKLIVE